MSRIIKCDRCGGEVNPKKIGYVSIMQRGEGGELCGDNPFENMDFCENCMTMIADFISAKVATQAAKTKSSQGGASRRRMERRQLAAGAWRDGSWTPARSEP